VAAEAGGLRGVAVAAALADLAAEAVVSVAEVRDRVGSTMRTKQFLSKLEHDRITSAIREAESKSSGEIRVFIQRGKLDADPLTVAQKKFLRLGMHKTRERNAALIFVAPRAHKFAIVGDKAIHEKCGEEFWQRVVEGMRTHFQHEKFSHALVGAIEEIGNLLAEHFPKMSTNPNELSDEVAEG